MSLTMVMCNWDYSPLALEVLPLSCGFNQDKIFSASSIDGRSDVLLLVQRKATSRTSFISSCTEGWESALEVRSLSGDFGVVEELEGVWGEEFVRERCPEVVVAAHGPVTAAGAERLGVKVDVMSSRFDSFEGVVDALGLK